MFDFLKSWMSALSSVQNRVRTSLGLGFLTIGIVGFNRQDPLRSFLYNTKLFGIPLFLILTSSSALAITFGVGLLLLAYLRGDYGRESPDADKVPSAQELATLIQAALRTQDDNRRAIGFEENPPSPVSVTGNTSVSKMGATEASQQAEASSPSLGPRGEDRIMLTFHYTRGRLREACG